ncbi:phage portal protein [Mariniphaga sediminis]|uniref:phage portal protein n=1 Tax=Mariniphaga sediminis TaxID=1628158 RepID=UPI0035651DD8
MHKYLEVIKKEVFSEIQKLFLENKPGFNYKGDAAKEYDVYSHSVMINDDLNRPDKKIEKPVINPVTGETVIDEATGNPKVTPAIAKVNRVPASFQEIIVGRRVSFLLGNPVKYDSTFNADDTGEKALVEFVYEIEENAKTLYKNKELARRMMSEMQCAELWYLTELKEPGFWNYVVKKLGIKKPQFQLKMKILSPFLGDTLYPLFDEFGDMIAFAREYKLQEDGKEIQHFDVYTEEFTYKYANRDNGFELDKQATNSGKIPNLANKIPIVYYKQEKPEWANVQKMIERLEKLLSNHGDMNDYFGEPILAIFGQLVKAVNKGDSGKILQLADNAKAGFLALDSPPESIKMEIENLEKFIYALSQTANISFAEMKAMGKDISGYAIELLFMDAHMAAIAKEEIFGIGIQRRVNLIKSFIGNVLDVSLSEASKSVRMKPVFTPYMPKNYKEMVEMLNQAVFNEILSTETAIEKMEEAGFIADSTLEQERLKQEIAEKSKLTSQIGANALGG